MINCKVRNQEYLSIRFTHLDVSGVRRPFNCMCLYIHCRFSNVTSPPRERITAPPLHEPTLQHSSSDRPLITPYKNPLAKRSPAPVASLAFDSPMAGTCTTLHFQKKHVKSFKNLCYYTKGVLVLLFLTVSTSSNAEKHSFLWTKCSHSEWNLTLG